MSIHNIRKAASLIGDDSLVKMANVNKDFSTDSKDETIATAVEISYLLKIAHESVPSHVIERVNKAVQLYGVGQEVNSFTQTMVTADSLEKKANVNEFELKVAEAYFEGNLSGLVDMEKAASQAEQLFDNYGENIESVDVQRYAGVLPLNKSAALTTLATRHSLTGNDEYVKIANIIKSSKDGSFDTDDHRLIARAVTMLDKQAKLNVKGFNFYKEAFTTKSAAVTALAVRLNGKSIPVETLMTKSAYFEQIVGEKLSTDPQTAKAMVESLPLDLQQILSKYV